MKLPIAGMLCLALCAAGAASAGDPFPTSHAPKLRDLGALRAVACQAKVTATVSLSLQNSDRLPSLVSQLYDRQGAQFRHFLTPAEFHKQFGPSAESVRRVTNDLREAGLTAELLNGTLLRVTGTPAQIERAFGVELRAMQATDVRGTVQFHAPSAAPKLRASWSGIVGAVLGLDDRPRFHPHNHVAHAAHTPSAMLADSKAPKTTDAPGTWTVTDFAQYYDVQPLYKSGQTGKGQTVGIVTLASFTPSDAFTYWSSLGLKTDANRLKVVNVDKGPGAPSDDSGSDETTLDVEQSGGIAPGAKIIVYAAPNTDQGFVDAFATAVSDNRADSVSTSWGEWEEYLPGSTVNSPGSGRSVDELKAFHDLFIQAAIQGQSLFAAAGDDGSYDANDPSQFALPQYSEVLAVDHPADDPFMTAAGGTTLPGEQDFELPSGKTYRVNIANERAWSWDYLDGLCAKLGYDPISCGTFPAGGGGGVSVLFDVPVYQQGLPGVMLSEKHQSLVDTSQTPPETLITLPGHFAGRNVPDISFNADPDTGYNLVYTSDQTGFGTTSYYGGTSFVAPQLAGVTALIDGVAGCRVGLLNFSMYELAQYGGLYSGRNPAARDITNGDNEFYKAGPGYDPASGLGVLDVANFAALFK